MVESILFLLKKFDGIVIKEKTDKQEAKEKPDKKHRVHLICGPLQIEAVGVPTEKAKKIYNAAKSNGNVMLSGGDGRVTLTNELFDRAMDGLAHRIAHAAEEIELRDQYRNIVCPGCSTKVRLHEGQKHCTWCGVLLCEEPIGEQLKLCIACPASEEGKNHWVYLEEMRFCPRCGRKTETMPVEIDAGELRFQMRYNELYQDDLGRSIEGWDITDEVKEWFGIEDPDEVDDG